MGNILEQSLTTLETGLCRSQTADGRLRNCSLRPSITLSKAWLMNVQLPCRYHYQKELSVVDRAMYQYLISPRAIGIFVK